MPIKTAADNILKYFFIFFLFFIEKKSWHLIHTTHQADSSHEMSTYFLWKIKTKFRMRSAALFYLALYVMLCMLGNFACFFVVCGFSFKIIFFFKKSFRYTIRMSNSLDSDQARQNVGTDLDPNCLQRFSADDKSRHQQGKS